MTRSVCLSHLLVSIDIINCYQNKLLFVEKQYDRNVVEMRYILRGTKSGNPVNSNQ